MTNIIEQWKTAVDNIDVKNWPFRTIKLIQPSDAVTNISLERLLEQLPLTRLRPLNRTYKGVNLMSAVIDEVQIYCAEVDCECIASSSLEYLLKNFLMGNPKELQPKIQLKICQFGVPIVNHWFMLNGMKKMVVLFTTTILKEGKKFKN